MNNTQRIALFVSRVVVGWFYFYAGITKVLSGKFSALGYLSHAKLMQGFYDALSASSTLPYVNMVNEWALTLLGVSLILGLWVRVSAPLGALLMLLYWIPLGIVHPDVNTMVVDQHIILISALFVLWAFRAGRIWGLDSKFQK